MLFFQIQFKISLANIGLCTFLSWVGQLYFSLMRISFIFLIKCALLKVGLVLVQDSFLNQMKIGGLELLDFSRKWFHQKHNTRSEVKALKNVKMSLLIDDFLNLNFLIDAGTELTYFGPNESWEHVVFKTSPTFPPFWDTLYEHTTSQIS